jgi:hypothetical protein
MTEDFVSFDLAKKLKEKGFDCNEPFAMYNELGIFHPLYTSCDETLENCIFGNRGYYDYDDFDEYDCVCPTISQVLKWLREEKKRHLLISTYHHTPFNVHDWGYDIINLKTYNVEHYDYGHNSYEASALAGIEYVIDNLI